MSAEKCADTHYRPNTYSACISPYYWTIRVIESTRIKASITPLRAQSVIQTDSDRDLVLFGFVLSLLGQSIVFFPKLFGNCSAASERAAHQIDLLKLNYIKTPIKQTTTNTQRQIQRLIYSIAPKM